MILNRVTVMGLRGFSRPGALDPATPNGKAGSGLTILVGPNGGGKSTVLEAMRVAGRQDAPSFSSGKRNQAAGDAVRIEWASDGSTSGRVESVHPASSETSRQPENARTPGLLYLPSRRAFNPFFSRQETTRENYQTAWQIPQNRAQLVEGFSGRLVMLERSANRSDFDALVSEIAGRRLEWAIDQEDSGQHFVKVGLHTSDGLGEGTVSVLFLADALYDSQPGDTIVIDEPELSLHPDHQRRLREVFSRYTSDRQIIVATHSPYFLDWADVANGALISRVHRGDDTAKISVPTRDTLDQLARVATDLNNPHVLGTSAAEVFFLEDGVILVEGQEDVVIYKAMARELAITLTGSYFGWGSGGAEKMPLIARLLRELGFTRVVGILDGDRVAAASTLQDDFPGYSFFAIPADDVRTKPARSATARKDGLANSDGSIATGREEDVRRVFEQVQEALAPLS